MSEPNGEIESTIVGMVLIGGSAWFLSQNTIPWQPWLGCTLVGLYLMLPYRMRNITDSLRSFLKNGKDKD